MLERSLALSLRWRGMHHRSVDPHVAAILHGQHEKDMAEAAAHHKRIVVVARPKLGRSVEATLLPAGYEVHRTPDGLDLHALAARLRPHLIIVALDLPWVDTVNAIGLLSKDHVAPPILLLGDAGADHRLNGTPRLSIPIDPLLLLATVGSLLAKDVPEHEL